VINTVTALNYALWPEKSLKVMVKKYVILFIEVPL
jgi:hypothetical protein